MARLAIGLPVEPVILMNRHPAHDRDAMVHFLAVQHLMDIAQTAEHIGGEGLVHHLGFLKAQYVRRFLGQELFDNVDARADAVDVPGCDGKSVGHGVALGG